jgi:hypothetical protein
LATGVANTVIVFESVAGPQEPPLVVRVRVAVPLYPAGGVQVASRSVSDGEKVPPAGVDQVPPVAEPPTEPPRAAEVPPWQKLDIAGPALAVGESNTVISLESVAVPQEPPLVVNVRVAVPL